MGSGKLESGGGADACELLNATFTYNVDKWKPELDYDAIEGELSIVQPSAGFIWGDERCEWDVCLNGGVETSLSPDPGSGGANLNLEDLSVNDIDIDIGGASPSI